ncbi:TSUP family transporter [Alkalicaulis satelles]|uniref:Probable membrane transporter protein n=1 Tax=Alkalicaulis satelles TaxID=2609175 RepID=A0A5M6ZGT5_9PROT|nr:TSUP family transporter [Alkalicaulis satelles]KAA5802358.1 TSUP family transporter [Alkalicaulis satelles]
MTALIILIAVFLTSALSAMLGMAGGLVLMGVLALWLPVPAAMVTHGLAQSVANGWRAVLLRRFILWRALGAYLAGSALAALLLFSVQIVLDRTWLLIVLGLVPFLVWLPPRLLPLHPERPAQGALAGFCVTGLNVVAGVSGPLLDVFFQNTRADRRAIVATKAASQVAAHGVKIAYYAAPALAASPDGLVWVLIIALPLSMAGTTLGARVLAAMSEADFRRWTRRAVTLIGLVYLGMGLAELMGSA